MQRHQKHGCGKVCYSKQEARKTVRAMKKNGKPVTRAYLCPVCKNAWHVTRQCFDRKRKLKGVL